MSDKGKEGDFQQTRVEGSGWEEWSEIARYREILAREPSSIVFAPLSEAYRKRGMLSQAIEVCIRGLGHHPNFVSGRVALARALYDAGELDRARQEAEAAVKAAHENLAALRLLASICRDQKDREGLRRTLAAIASLDPADRRALEELEGMEPGSDSAGDRPISGTSIRREIVTKTLAEIYASQGYYERAIEIYRKLRVLAPADESFCTRIEELRQKAVRPLRGKPRNEGRS